MSNEQVLEIVRRHLQGYRPAGTPIEVVGERIERKGNFWFVPVRLLGEITRRYRYYEDLADAEEEIRDTEHLDILLVPTG